MKISSYIANSVLGASALSLILYAASSHAAALDVSQSTVLLVESVSPNRLSTVDVSGSMEFAHTPECLGDKTFKVNGVTVCPNDDSGCINTRRVKSSDINPLAYNPSAKDVIPTQA